MDWIQDEIVSGLQQLLCLGLERQPASELMPGTAAMWVKVITNRRVFDQPQDMGRFREAFLTLAERTTWPVPQDFINALPPRVEPRPVLRIDSEERRERNKAKLREMLKGLGIVSHRDEEDAA